MPRLIHLLDLQVLKGLLLQPQPHWGHLTTRCWGGWGWAAGGQLGVWAGGGGLGWAAGGRLGVWAAGGRLGVWAAGGRLGLRAAVSTWWWVHSALLLS